MADRKLFAGPRVRRIRNGLGLSQSDMAEKLGISPSYLNLIERNQRPVTVQVLLRLSGAFGIDVAELQAGGDAEGLSGLRAVFADPLLSGELPAPDEIAEVAEAAPNLARGVARLYDAYRATTDRLSELSQAMAGGQEAWTGTGRLPFDRVAAWFEENSPWFTDLEMEAGALGEQLAPRDDLFAALKGHLRERHGVDTRVLPVQALAGERARYDRHSLRLFISECVPLPERAWIVGYQIAMLGHGALLENLSKASGLDDAESLRLMRAAFARRFAQALIMPADRLETAALDLRFDIAALAQRFQSRPSRVMARLAALGARRSSRVGECAFLAVDRAGNTLMRIRGGGFPFARVGAPCGRLPLFDQRPAGMPGAVRLEFPHADQFMALSLSEESLPGAGEPAARIAMLLAWPHAQAPKGLWEQGGGVREAGVSCRLCERTGCAQRAFPPATRPAGFLDYAMSLSDHEVP